MLNFRASPFQNYRSGHESAIVVIAEFWASNSVKKIVAGGRDLTEGRRRRKDLTLYQSILAGAAWVTEVGTDRMNQ